MGPFGSLRFISAQVARLDCEVKTLPVTDHTFPGVVSKMPSKKHALARSATSISWWQVAGRELTPSRRSSHGTQDQDKPGTPKPAAPHEEASRANDQKDPVERRRGNRGGNIEDGKNADIPQGGKRRGPGRWVNPTE